METEAQIEQHTEEPHLSTGIGCPKCGKTFSNEKGLRMHDIRKHQKGWSTSQNFYKEGTKQTKEQVRKQKRDYNRKLRARYHKEGRNSRGELMPAGWKPRARSHWRVARERRLANLNRSGGKPWTDAQREKFRHTMRVKARTRIPIVYPDPRDSELTRQDEMEAQSVVTPKLKHCPNCGEHIEGWSYRP